jgi:hypothetical protein
MLSRQWTPSKKRDYTFEAVALTGWERRIGERTIDYAKPFAFFFG